MNFRKLVAALIVVAAGASPRLLAATVNTLVDEQDGSITDGDVSLRDAIAATAAGGTIDFSVTGTIVLTRGELKITKTVTINGPGRTLLTIDASGNDPTPNAKNGDGSRALLIDDGVFSTQTKVRITALSIRGGDVTGNGGGFYSREIIQLSGVDVAGNAATNQGGGGFTEIYRVEATDVTFSANTAKNAGGGLYIAGSNDSTLQNVSFTGNVAGAGGGLYTRGGVAHAGGAYTNNRATFGGGGAVYNAGSFSAQMVQFVDNASSGDGGAIVFAASARGSTFAAEFRQNNATGSGGAVWDGSGAYSSIGDAFDGNAARYGGGALYLTGAPPQALGPQSLTGSDFTENSSHVGGAIYMGLPTTVVIRGGKMTGNSANNGGAIRTSGALTLQPSGDERLEFSENLAMGDGGAIANYAKLTVVGVDFRNNSATGSGIVWTSGNNASLDDVLFESNEATFAGGGVMTSGNGYASITHATIRSNHANQGGGVFNSVGCGMRIANSTVAENSASSGPDVRNSGTLKYGPNVSGNLINVGTVTLQ